MTSSTDCDGDEISYPINIDDQLEDSGDENEQTENATSNEPGTSTDNVADGEQNLTSCIDRISSSLQRSGFKERCCIR